MIKLVIVQDSEEAKVTLTLEKFANDIACCTLYLSFGTIDQISLTKYVISILTSILKVCGIAAKLL